MHVTAIVLSEITVVCILIYWLSLNKQSDWPGKIMNSINKENSDYVYILLPLPEKKLA